MGTTSRLASAVHTVNGEAVEISPTSPGEHDVRLRLGATDCADVTVDVAGVRLLLNVDGNGRVGLWAVRSDVPAASEEGHTAELWHGNVVTSLAEKASPEPPAAGQTKVG